MFNEGRVPAGGHATRFGPKRESVFARKGQWCVAAATWGATSFPFQLQQPMKGSVCTLLGEQKLLL